MTISNNNDENSLGKEFLSLVLLIVIVVTNFEKDSVVFYLKISQFFHFFSFSIYHKVVGVVARHHVVCKLRDPR